jgi:hypothetical protein
MRCRLTRNILYLALFSWILPCTAGLGAQQKAGLPGIGVVKFLISSSAFKDIDNAAAIRDLVVRSIGASGKYNVVDTTELDSLIEQNNVSVSKLYDPVEMEKIPLTYVQFLVTGFISLESKGYRINMYFLDLSKKEFLFNEDVWVSSEKENSIWFGVRDFTRKFIERMESVISEKDLKPEEFFRVGDTGPAGGIIFFAKGKYTDGWQYLEAAPPETEFRAVWAVKMEDNTVVPALLGTRGGVGTGFGNTELCVKDASMFKIENGPAALACRKLDFGGYTDWFLPSKDELMFMYMNLASRGLGGFRGEAYWSSTESSYDDAYFQSFREGRQFYNGYKMMPLYVRAIRAF